VRSDGQLTVAQQHPQQPVHHCISRYSSLLGYNQRVHIEAESIYKALKKRNKQEANVVHVMS